MSQQNVVIDRPLIRPRPVAYLGKNYYLYDNFADGLYNNRVGVAANGFRYQDWTVTSGTWSIVAGELKQTFGGGAIITTPLTTVGTTYEFKHRIEGAGDRGSNFHIMYVDATHYYYVKDIVGNGGVTSHLELVKNIGAGEVIMIATDRAIDTNTHTIKVTRDAVGNFELFFDGASKGTATDNNVTTCALIRIESQWFGQPFYHDDIKVY